MKNLTAALTVTASLLLTGCGSVADRAQVEAPAAAAINTTCPVMGEEIDPEVTTSYNGATVAFCCKGCVSDWNEMSEDERNAFVTKATK